TATLPGYALGQPIEDARNVVPAGQSRESWRLHCAGDPGAPAGLDLSDAERTAGVGRCWTFEVSGGIERRATFPQGNAHHSTQELEFWQGRIVRITEVRYASEADRAGRRVVLSKPEAAEIDR